ncbi:hypothetical protein TRICI_005028 [Trichomonascus ciferrii]|uniref:EF-hand domain-containing protein n=1 Tax=Trichomonascus ciferrii TaxID=44093 RepID=A0A642UXG8_9ASCO|nr:hypothetical protein TRICI_005028 [Trichomonascus ciferrii]
MKLDTRESVEEQERRYRRLFDSLDVRGADYLDASDLRRLLEQRYQPFDNMEEIVDELIVTIGQTSDGRVDFESFKKYMMDTEGILERTFETLDLKKDGMLDLQEIQDGFSKLDLNVDEQKVALFFSTLDLDEDGYISLEDWRYNLLFIPNRIGSPLEAAYIFFIEDMDLSSEGDVILSSETLNGVGYFLAGGLAGVVSRTCTAPFDRLKVFLIAQSGEPLKQQAGKAAAKAASPNSTILGALKHIWSLGGVRAFFVGNGLNVIKVFPESAMKFGSFEAAKRFFCTVEGVADPSELSRASTFLSGGIGGVLSQFTIYPIDTLKFRIQCSRPTPGQPLIKTTMQQMWREGGLSLFYRGVLVGVCGIFPFAALDLGTFSAMKRAYLAGQARKLGVEPSEVELGNMAVLTMGALSGSVGASAVYPINLLRTRLQAQGTAAHPYTYTGFMDVLRKTVARDGPRGLFRGLGPNLAKVAPAVSISYLVYENAKQTMNLA